MLRSIRIFSVGNVEGDAKLAVDELVVPGKVLDIVVAVAGVVAAACSNEAHCIRRVAV